MTRTITTLSLITVLLLMGRAPAFTQGQELNPPAPASAQALVKQGVELVNHDRFEQAVAAFTKAIAAAPRYLKAHVEYIRTRAYFQEAYNEVRLEYEALMAKEPGNAIYPVALELGTRGATSYRVTRARYEKVVAAAPEWAWGHYAKAQLLMSKDPAAAAAELVKAIEKDPTAAEAYRDLISLQERQLRNLDDAIATAEKMAAQPELRSDGFARLWRLRLGQAQGSDAAKATLKAALDQLASSSRDVDLLAAVRSAYQYDLKDKATAEAVEKRILQLDPAWYQWRGFTNRFGAANLSRVGRDALIAGRQMDLFVKVEGIDDAELAPKEKMAKLEQTLTLKPGRVMTRFTLETLFKIAEKAKDAAALVKYGDELYAIDPTDVAALARMAMVLAEEKKNLNHALRYARLADEATMEFRPMQPGPMEDPELFKDWFPEDRQQEIYRSQRALALEAHGWALCQMGMHREAEAKLRQAVEVARSERNLSNLAEALRRVGRTEEAETIAVEAHHEYAKAIRNRLTNQPAKDFQLAALDGRTIRLSDLKGKVVMLNFWATTCGPCITEMPHLVKLYERYRSRGVEILAISTDTDAYRHAVPPFAKKYGLNFPVLYDEGAEKAYQVNGIPTTVFIDREGHVRYRNVGFSATETIRVTEVVLNELLK
jgi:peroxiredoxin